jgi:hypothetical protein
VLTFALVTALSMTARAGMADQRYSVSGEDVYRVGLSSTASRVLYDGTQVLSVHRHADGARYDARAQYVRIDRQGKTDGAAHFVQELLPDGSFVDRVDDDPDFLTILNQPFAIQLDQATLRDLERLHSAVPFDASSPLGGAAVLRGFLRPGTGGDIAGTPAVAVRFEAQGPMNGPLPGDTQATMAGRMRMDGTAYYSLGDAMLLALDATLTIDASLKETKTEVPVRITYRRYIRAAPKTPPPTPLPTGAGTATPAAP